MGEKPTSATSKHALKTASTHGVDTAQHPVQRFSIRDLVGSGREAIIEHNGADYRLRITANGRLILTK